LETILRDLPKSQGVPQGNCNGINLLALKIITTKFPEFNIVCASGKQIDSNLIDSTNHCQLVYWDEKKMDTLDATPTSIAEDTATKKQYEIWATMENAESFSPPPAATERGAIEKTATCKIWKDLDHLRRNEEFRREKELNSVLNAFLNSKRDGVTTVQKVEGPVVDVSETRRSGKLTRTKTSLQVTASSDPYHGLKDYFLAYTQDKYYSTDLAKDIAKIAPKEAIEIAWALLDKVSDQNVASIVEKAATGAPHEAAKITYKLIDKDTGNHTQWITYIVIALAKVNPSDAKKLQKKLTKNGLHPSYQEMINIALGESVVKS
jgi:hypothetical protein